MAKRFNNETCFFMANHENGTRIKGADDSVCVAHSLKHIAAFLLFFTVHSLANKPG